MTRYNGWSSYETWNVVLYLKEDQTMYDIFETRCNVWRRCGMAPSDLKYSVVMTYLDMNFSSPSGPVTPDGVSLYSPEVNWQEIYNYYMDVWDVDVDERGVNESEENEFIKEPSNDE